MADLKKNAEVATTKLGIVARIMKVLKLDDEGKIGKFFAKEVKKAENYIRDLGNNKIAMTNVHTSNLQTMSDNLEDAKEALENTYQGVTIENVATNDAMTSFADTYWNRVANAEAKVEKIEKAIKDAEEAHVKALENVDKQIAKYQARIDRINS